jgi:signal transduction histidine kinase
MPGPFQQSKRIRYIFVIYWILLAYICAALIWWFIALNFQNRQMAIYKKLDLHKKEAGYDYKLKEIEATEKRKTTQYIGEGSIFFLLIVAGAIFIYRAVRNQLKAGLQQQNFMMAITHELKTPIAVTKLNLETLQKRKLEESQQQKLIQNTIQEANRLNSLCNNLLLASQIEAGGYAITREEIDISTLSQDAVNDFCIRFPQRNIKAEIPPSLFVKGDHLLLQMAINNLIDNAIKYSPKELEITILLFLHKNHIHLQVIDRGKGIDDAEKKKVFEKFYRLGNTATRGAKGTGLGLYLTKKIVQQHEGNIFITDNSPTGSIFTIELKAA